MCAQDLSIRIGPKDSSKINSQDGRDPAKYMRRLSHKIIRRTRKMDAMNMTLEEILRGFALQAETWKYEAMGVALEAIHA